jgi:hypothetical protein
MKWKSDEQTSAFTRSGFLISFLVRKVIDLYIGDFVAKEIILNCSYRVKALKIVI